tara:strand:- start:19914 stop:21317 length:1404 start_codon:yes stop_codon:yes gene_type:complete
MEDLPNSISTDLLIIGSGPGGYEAALHASQLGLNVILAEMENYGGACLHHGCIPSKTLLNATNMVYNISHAENMGIFSSPSIDFTQMISWKDEIISRIEGQIKKMCSAKKIKLLQGKVTFLTTTSALLTPLDPQARCTISFKHAIIATGSKSVELPEFEFDSEYILNSKTALSLSTIPKKLVIIGAGYIGMELSALFSKLGTQIDVIELQNKILPEYESDISNLVQKHSKNLGITFHFNESVSSWEKSESGIKITTATRDGKKNDYFCDRAIVAIGRHPVTETLNLGAISITPDQNGFIETDDSCRTTVPNIFAIGDVSGPPMLAHKASAEGKKAVDTICAKPTPSRKSSIPSVVFTTPEIGTIGLTNTQAKEAGIEVNIGKVSYGSIGRSHLTNEPLGFVRIVSNASDGTIIGGQIVGSRASELVAEIGLAIQSQTTVSDLADTIHAHPTYSELIVLAARMASSHQ